MASRAGMYAKMAGVLVVCCVGGPALMYYVTPAEGEVFKRFNPDLQKRNLAMRDQRMKDYEEFLSQLKEYSQSDKPIWTAAADAQKEAREKLLQKEAEERALQQKAREEMKAQALGR